MKIFIYVLMALTLGLIIFNLTQLDFDNIMEGQSAVALICTVAAMCALCILLIFNTAKTLDEKIKKR